MRYRVLALDAHSEHMSLPVLRKIRDLVKAGAIVAGSKPTDTPSLSDDPKEFQSIADELWGSGTGEHPYGKGKVYAGPISAEDMRAIQVRPDFEYTKPQSDTEVLFVHRKLSNGDLYFVDNRQDQNLDMDATFRIAGKEAELWHADTGVMEPASFRSTDGRTTVPLHLEPWGTVFVVFRKAATTPSRTLPKIVDSPVATVGGPWDVTFQADRGAPPKITLDTLASWSENSDEGVKYFSGAGTYTKTVQAGADWFVPGTRLSLDLGEVKNLAQVIVNGKSLGIVWKTPYRVDVTGSLKPGANTIEIKVTNPWVNRIIGDRQPNAAKTYTFTSPKFYKADAKLVPSGLLGPVQIIRSTSEMQPK
jgi:hypothetical protein